VRARSLDLRVLESPRGHVRVAIVVPKHGHNSVKRNKLKRQLREITRTHVLPARSSFDVLVRARREAYAATFDALLADIRVAATRLGASGSSGGAGVTSAAT